MLSKINFARESTGKRKKQQQKDKKFLLIASAVCVAMILIAIAAFIMNFYFQKKVTTNKKEQDRLAEQWEVLKADETAFTIYAQKVKILASLFNSRQQKQAALKKFRSLFGEGATVVGLNYSAETREIVFQIKSDSIFVLDDVVDRLDSVEIQENFGTVHKERLSRSDEGQYTLAVRVSLDNDQQD